MPETLQTMEHNLSDTVAQVQALMIVAQGDEHGCYVQSNTTNQPTRRTRSENATYVFASIRSLGFQPHPESRLMFMCRVLTEPRSSVLAGCPTL